jgi:hypothetical protein
MDRSGHVHTHRHMHTHRDKQWNTDKSEAAQSKGGNCISLGAFKS